MNTATFNSFSQYCASRSFLLRARNVITCALLAAAGLSGAAMATPILIYDFGTSLTLEVGQTTEVKLVVTNLGADEVLTAFDVNVDFSESIASASNLQINLSALDTDVANSGALVLGNGFTHVFFGFTNAGIFNSNTFADLKALQGGGTGAFTLASFLLTGVSTGSTLVSFSSPFLFGIETSATFGQPTDLGDTAAGPGGQITVTSNDNPLPAPGGAALVLFGIAALARSRRSGAQLKSV